MRSIFEVVTPAADPYLLTIQQARVAAGLANTDASQDAKLEILRKRVSSEIIAACRIRGDGTNMPTLRSEVVRETFRVCGRDDSAILGRMFVSAVATVTESGTTLIAADTWIDREAGIVHRIAGSQDIAWRRGELVVQYTAGFATVPDDLVGAAMDLARLRMSADSIDPLEKSSTIEIPDVETRRIDRWVGAVPGSSAGPVPADIAARLSRFMNVVVA